MSTKVERIAILAALLLPVFAQAQESIGRVLMAKGQVEARAVDGTRRSLSRRAQLYPGDTLLTGADGFVSVRMVDGAQISLTADTGLTVDEYRFDADPSTPDVAAMTLVQGCFRSVSGSISGAPDEHRIDTSIATIQIRGTFHEAAYDGTTLYTATLAGGTTVLNGQGSVDLGLGGSYAYSKTVAGTAPEGFIFAPSALKECSGSSAPGNAAPQPGQTLFSDRDFSAAEP
jgi:hypothetical protein